jgi:hypothetical protein
MIYWRRGDAERMSIALGTVDPLYLFGEGSNEENGIPKDGFGKALMSGLGGNEWAGNEIKGVTDDMPLLCRPGARKFLGDEQDGVVYE